jgi:hypothetical protein
LATFRSCMIKPEGDHAEWVVRRTLAPGRRVPPAWAAPNFHLIIGVWESPVPHRTGHLLASEIHALKPFLQIVSLLGHQTRFRGTKRRLVLTSVFSDSDFRFLSWYSVNPTCQGITARVRV